MKTPISSVLFVCTGNSCRSQMAEGWCRYFFPDILSASAGVKAVGINPYAAKVMLEVGVDISNQSSETLDVYDGQRFDLVVTVCDNAKQNCPVLFTEGTTLHHTFEDPPALAAQESSDEAKLAHYRRVRDEIKEFVRQLG